MLDKTSRNHRRFVSNEWSKKREGKEKAKKPRDTFLKILAPHFTDHSHHRVARGGRTTGQTQDHPASNSQSRSSGRPVTPLAISQIYLNASLSVFATISIGFSGAAPFAYLQWLIEYQLFYSQKLKERLTRCSICYTSICRSRFPISE